MPARAERHPNEEGRHVEHPPPGGRGGGGRRRVLRVAGGAGSWVLIYDTIPPFNRGWGSSPANGENKHLTEAEPEKNLMDACRPIYGDYSKKILKLLACGQLLSWTFS